MNDQIGLLEAVAENTEMGKNTLAQMLPMAEDEAFRAELNRQREGYCRLNQRAHRAMAGCGGCVKGQSEWAKLNTRMGIAMETLRDHSAGKLADMLVEGSNQGVMDCVKSRREFPDAGAEALQLSEELERFQQQNIEALKRFLGS